MAQVIGLGQAQNTSRRLSFGQAGGGEGRAGEIRLLGADVAQGAVDRKDFDAPLGLTVDRPAGNRLQII